MFKREIVERGEYCEINVYNPDKTTVMIDKEDLEKLQGRRVHISKPSKVNNCQYASIRIKNKQVLLHIYLLGKRGGLSIDHINHNGLDNRRSNLRHATHSQNKQNCPSKSVYGKGVQKRVFKHGQIKYRARIRFKRVLYNLGHFDTAIDAAKAYNTKAKEFFGDFAYLNEIP